MEKAVNEALRERYVDVDVLGLPHAFPDSTDPEMLASRFRFDDDAARWLATVTGIVTPQRADVCQHGYRKGSCPYEKEIAA